MSQPLAGLNILDFSTLLPGPYATQLLSDMGANVVRVESPTRVDMLKTQKPMLGHISAAHAAINRNKKSIAIDLKHADAKDIVTRLLGEFDIVIEQFRPGVMSRLGLSYADLADDFPELIYCSITGYGQTGVLSPRAGHDINYLALSGLASYSGRKETGPVLSGTQIADIAGGSHHAVMAIMAAVIERSSTGKGQYLDISMSDCAMALTTITGAGALATGEDPGYATEMLNGGLFYEYYRTSDDRYLSVGSLEPQFATGLVRVLELEDCAALMVKDDEASQTELRQKIAEKIGAQTFAHWQAVFADEDVCVEPVLTVSEASQHPHFVERGMIGSAVDEHGNRIKQFNSALPFKRSENLAGVSTGKDTADILATLGYSEDEISALKASKCVG